MSSKSKRYVRDAESGEDQVVSGDDLDITEKVWWNAQQVTVVPRLVLEFISFFGLFLFYLIKTFICVDIHIFGY